MPGVVIVRGPVYRVSDVPAGTPVLLAPGFPPVADPPPVVATGAVVVDGVGLVEEAEGVDGAVLTDAGGSMEVGVATSELVAGMSDDPGTGWGEEDVCVVPGADAAVVTAVVLTGADCEVDTGVDVDGADVDGAEMDGLVGPTGVEATGPDVDGRVDVVADVAGDDTATGEELDGRLEPGAEAAGEVEDGLGDGETSAVAIWRWSIRAVTAAPDPACVQTVDVPGVEMRALEASLTASCQAGSAVPAVHALPLICTGEVPVTSKRRASGAAAVAFTGTSTEPRAVSVPGAVRVALTATRPSAVTRDRTR